MKIANRKSCFAWIAVAALCCAAGCARFHAEHDCPTDARRIYFSCAGEEAVRRCPCGPDQTCYGHRPTQWRAWPAGCQCTAAGFVPMDAAGSPTLEWIKPYQPPQGTDKIPTPVSEPPAGPTARQRTKAAPAVRHAIAAAPPKAQANQVKPAATESTVDAMAKDIVW